MAACKWVTLSEAWVVTDGGYLQRAGAGHAYKFEAPIASHSLMRAHGARRVKAYREISRHEIGLVVNIEPKYPAAIRRMTSPRPGARRLTWTEQYLHPALLGH